MQQLHAYWRMDYIEAPRYPPAMKRPFSELPAMGDDRAALIVHRSQLSFLLLNRYPYNNGHLMAAPRRHVASLELLTRDELIDLSTIVAATVQRLRIAYKPAGLNVGLNLGRAAGAGIADHMHWHLVPRWDGDNNFMPVIAHTRVLPQAP